MMPVTIGDDIFAQGNDVQAYGENIKIDVKILRR
jgi:hypothetical protein